MTAIRITTTHTLAERGQTLIENSASALQDALITAADGVAQEARERVLAQRSPARPLPSALANSIRRTLTEGGSQARISAGGDKAPYAVFVEFGTARQPARPFLFPAFEARKSQIIAALATAIAGVTERLE